MSRLRRGDRTRPLVWQLGMALGDVFSVREDLVRVNTGRVEAGPGYDHSHVLVFTAEEPGAATLRDLLPGRHSASSRR